MNLNELYIEEQNLREMLSNPLSDFGFRVTKYLKDGLDYKQLINLLCVYEEWRGCNEYEDIYRLKDKDDCVFLINKYGVDKIVNYISAGYEYAFDGLNFADMVVIKNEDIKDTIDKLCDLDFIAGMVGNGCGGEIAQFFNMEDLLITMAEMGFVFKTNEDVKFKSTEYHVKIGYLDGTKEDIRCFEYENAQAHAERALREWVLKDVVSVSVEEVEVKN